MKEKSIFKRLTLGCFILKGKDFRIPHTYLIILFTMYQEKIGIKLCPTDNVFSFKYFHPLINSLATM